MGKMINKMITDIVSEKINSTSIGEYESLKFEVEDIEEYDEDLYGCSVDVSLDSEITTLDIIVRAGEVSIRTYGEDDIGEEFTESNFWRTLFFFKK